MRIALLGPAHLDPLLPHLELPPGRHKNPLRRIAATPVAPLAASLLDRGHDVLLVSLDTAINDEIILEGERLRVRVGPYRPRHRARDAFAVERRYLTSVLADEDCDVVHAHWSYEYALGALASPHPTLVTLRDWAPTVLRMHPDPYRLVRLMMNFQVLYSAEHFTVTSPYMRRKLGRLIRRPIAIIPNGLPDALFQQRERGPNLRSPQLLAVNNGFQRRKNVPTLLKAFATVRAWNPLSTLRLIGHGFNPNGEAQRWAEFHGLAEAVSFSGPLPPTDVFETMTQADLLVHPAREESFGMVLVEALATGLPVVAGRQSGAVPWVLDHGNAGMLTDVSSPSGMAHSIIKLLSEPQRWRYFSKAGFHRAWTAFRLARVVDDYQSAYAAVLRGHSL